MILVFLVHGAGDRGWHGRCLESTGRFGKAQWRHKLIDRQTDIANNQTCGLLISHVATKWKDRKQLNLTNTGKLIYAKYKPSQFPLFMFSSFRFFSKYGTVLSLIFLFWLVKHEVCLLFLSSYNDPSF